VQAALWPLAGFAGSLAGGALPSLFAGLLGVPLDSPAPYRYPLFVAAGLLVPALLALLATHSVEAVAANSSAHVGRFPLAIIVFMALIGFLRVSGEGIGRTFFNVYLDDGLHISTTQIGSMLAFAQLLAAPAALYAPVLATRWGAPRLILWGTVVVGLSLLLMVLVPHWLMAGAGFLVMLVLVSITRPIWTVYSQEIVDRTWWSAMSGATTMAVGLSWSATALGGGYMIASYGYGVLFVTGALLTAAGALLFGLHRYVRRRSAQPLAASATPAP
jgi:predicted MFS family arabinose efflux permease